jgi:multidrug/hemolysin transport system permease protein
MALMYFVRRNILVYLRDRASVFFSFLSMLIIIGLMAVFLGNMNIDNVVNLLNQYGGVRDAAADRENAKQLVLMWTLAGIVVVNSVTITLTMVGIMVEDEHYHKLVSFYVAPIKRGFYVLGYILSAIIMGIIMCLVTVGVGELYIGLTGGMLLTIEQFGKVFLIIVLNVFLSSSIVFFITNFVHSTSAFSGISTIIGTLVGFLAAIYLPMGMLPQNIQNVLKGIPLLHGCSLMRDIFTEQALQVTFKNSPAELLNGYKEYMGMTIYMGDNLVNNEIKVAFLLISGIILITISILLQKRRNTVKR